MTRHFFFFFQSRRRNTRCSRDWSSDVCSSDLNYSFNSHKNDNGAYLTYLQNFGAPIPPGTVNTGQNKDISIVAGSNFADGKGNATLYATYLKSNPSVGYQFDHAGCTLIGGSTPGSSIRCGG